ncbi:hypothetical protein C8Q70DRAFT_527488 [Cubamyces menziesii]|nr:hypothetical protein C8Q70DRAFT_527488 [Cubamyces menziesii]
MPRIASTSLPHLAARTRPTSGSQRPYMRPTTARPTTRLMPPSAPSHAGAAGLTNSQWGDVPVISGSSASTQLQISVTQATAAVEETPSSAHGWNDIYAPLDAGFADFGAMIHGRIPTVHEQHERPYRPQQWSHPPPAQAFNYPPPADYPFSFSLPESTLNFSTQSTHMSRNAVPQTLPFYDARQPAAPVQMSTANVPTTSVRFSTTRPYVRDQGLATSSAPLNRPTEQFQPESELFAALGNAAGGSSAYLGSNQPVQGHSEFTDALGGPGLSSIASFDAITFNMYAAEAVAATTFTPSHDIGVNLQGDYAPTAADHYSSDMALWFEQYLRDMQADSQSVGMPENPFATLPESAVWPEEGSRERPNAGS